MANKKGFICEGCGGALDYTLYKGGIIECKYCFRQNTVPREDIDDDAKQLMFNGKFSLKARKFDDARLAFRELAEKNPEEAEAYWGMALAEFNVQYIYDINKEGEDKLQVLCKEVDKKFTDSENYKKALKYASDEQKKVYKKKGEDIDTVREQFLHFKDEQNLEYDCFICVKVTEELIDDKGNKVLDDKGKPKTKKTYDSTMAAEVYNFLKEKGFKPFYSEKEIKGRTGEAYEAMILYALYKSECMLVVCSDEKYLQTPWVKSEYTRFLELINDKEKASTSITTIFDGNPIDRLDGKNGRIQGIDKNRADWEDLLYDYVMDHSPTGRKRKQEAQAKRDAEEAEKRRIAEEERRRKEEEERKNKEAIAAMQAKIDEMSQTKTAPLDKIGSMNAKKIIKFAYDLLDGRRFEQAYENFNEVLKMDSDNCDAWWGMFLVEMKVVDGDEIIKKIDAKLWKEIQSNPFYIKACAKAEQSSKDERVDVFNGKVKTGQLWWDIFLKDFSVNTENELLKNLTIDLVDKINKNVHYNLALEYASGKFKENTVDPFNAQFSNAQIWWENFLKDFKVKEESELFDRLDRDLLNKVDGNKNYVYAVKYATGDSGVEKRIRDFQAIIHSPLFWWKKFARSMGIPKSMLERKQYEECNEGKIIIDRGMSYRLKKDVENNQYYQLALQFAKKCSDPIFEEHYKRFNDVYESSHSYYWLLLEDFGVNSDEDFLRTGFFRIGLGDEIKNNVNYKIIRQKKDKQDNIILDDILAGIEYQTEQYQEAKKRWQAFINKLSCQKERQLLACDLYIGEEPDFIKVKKYAEDSHVEEFIKQLTAIESKQRDAFDKRIARRKEEKKKRTAKIISGIFIIIIPAILLAFATKYMTDVINYLMELAIDTDLVKVNGNQIVTVDTLPVSLKVCYYMAIAVGGLSILFEAFRRKSGVKRLFRAIGCVIAVMVVLMMILSAEIVSLLTYDKEIFIVTAAFGVFAVLSLVPCLADTSFGCAAALFPVSVFYQLYYLCYAHYFPNTPTIFWQNIVVLIFACFVMLTVLAANLGDSDKSVAWGIIAPYTTLFLFCIAVMAFHSQLAGKFWPGAWSLVTLIATVVAAGLGFFSMEAYGDLRREISSKKKIREERKAENAALKKIKN